MEDSIYIPVMDFCHGPEEWTTRQASDSSTVVHLSSLQLEELSPSFHVWTGQYDEVIGIAPAAISSKTRSTVRQKMAIWYDWKLGTPGVGYADIGVPTVYSCLASRESRQRVKKPSVRRSPCRNHMRRHQELSGVVPDMTWRDDREDNVQNRSGKKRNQNFRKTYRGNNGRGEEPPT